MGYAGPMCARGFALAVSLLLGCGDPCASVTCSVAGTVCGTDGLCHCGAGPACAEGQVCDAEAGACLPGAVCGAGHRWTSGERAFTEATSEWALDGVVGVRLQAVDFDGDGWTDLMVRNIPAGFDDFGPGGARHSWLLRNVAGARFEDVTESSGILSPRGAAPGGRPVEVMAWGDVDGDGDLDAYLGMNTVDLSGANMGETSELMFQTSAGHFEVGPDTNGVRFVGGVDSPGGAAFVDFDRDGDLDLWVGEATTTGPGGGAVFHQDRLWRNDGTGLFTEATVEAGLTTLGWTDLAAIDEGRAHARAWSAAACDLTGDGWDELLVASYGRAPNHLFEANGDGTFTNRSVSSGYAYDADMGWQDNQFARCYCQANPTATDCAGVPAPLIACTTPNWNHTVDRRPFRLGGNSGTTICADVDLDGDLDLLTTEIRHWWAGSGADMAELLVNTGESPVRLTRPGRAATGLVVPHADPVQWDEGIMTAAVFDFDLDGWPDIYLGASDYPGNHGLLYHQESVLSFAPVPVTDGIDHHRSHGIAVADFDRDGDLDVALGHSRSRCGAPDDCYPTAQVRLFEGSAAPSGNWVQLRLEGAAGSNPSAIGARVVVSPEGGQAQTHEIGGGHGHYGMQDDLVQTFGLGAACTAEVTVRWPDAAGTTQRFRATAGHRFSVRTGEPPRDDPPSGP